LPVGTGPVVVRPSTAPEKETAAEAEATDYVAPELGVARSADTAAPPSSTGSAAAEAESTASTGSAADMARAVVGRLVGSPCSAADDAYSQMGEILEALEERLLGEIERRGGRFSGVF
jgi:hypothetical protein